MRLLTIILRKYCDRSETRYNLNIKFFHAQNVDWTKGKLMGGGGVLFFGEGVGEFFSPFHVEYVRDFQVWNDLTNLCKFFFFRSIIPFMCLVLTV